MADLSKVFRIARLVILILVTIFSAVVLIVGALVTDFISVHTVDDADVTSAIVISALTLPSVPAMILIPIIHKESYPSMIIVELSYLVVLWVSWLTVAGSVANIVGINHCSSYDHDYSRACMETQAIAAFSFLNWLLLMALNFFLLVLVVRQAHLGNSAIWTSFVTEVDYSAPAPSSPEPKVAPGSPASPGVTHQHPQPVPGPQGIYPLQQVSTLYAQQSGMSTAGQP